MAQKFGVIGLAVMGENLALNVESKGFPVAVYNRSPEKTDNFVKRAKEEFNLEVAKDSDDDQDKPVFAAYSLESFVNALERPRRILVMVKAGRAVDAVIEQLKPLLEKGDMIIDGGNSLYTDTQRRTEELEPTGLGFIGMGVSGGEEGALLGPSLMPGGTEAAYREIEAIVTKIAAQVDDGPCVTYIGPGGAGHFVKMVHNGIEYGDMQIIAEAYDLMKTVLGLDHNELYDVFSEWYDTPELDSYLIEITKDIFTNMDEKTGKPLVEMIVDAAGQKGTGLWTATNALEMGVAIPTIIAAVNARIMSSLKDQRVAASKELSGPSFTFSGDKQTMIDKIRDAMYCSKICSYAQGMDLISQGNQELFEGKIDLGETARIWKGGCIIRARFLNKIKHAYDENGKLANLLLAPEFKQTILDRQDAWREVISLAAQAGIPVPAFSASLDYFDSYRRDRLPQNLTQAQRDYFGAHTYERVDEPRGNFIHHEWQPAPSKAAV